uniref:CREB/ATF bZIP transcription factor n=1 Tax=Cacopsylla melanoneura TaxID=428564 RepID=A0A8D9DVS0_9HEMI
MSRRKPVVTKRSEYVAQEEASFKVQTRKRKIESEVESDFSDECEWEPIQSSPKMMKINREKPTRSESSSSVVDHDYDIELNVDTKKHCTNRNALMARKNRIKKKMYVEKLENTIQELRSNYESMQKQILEQNEVIARVTKENRYLRNVITNSSGLKQILQGVRLAGLANRVHTTPMTRDPNLNQKGTDPLLNDNYYSDLFSDLDNEHFTDLLSLPVHVTEDAFPSSTTSEDVLDNIKLEALNGVKPDIPDHDFSTNPQVGLCVHIINNTLSVEFCETCNESAYSNLLSRNSSDLFDLDNISV